MTDNEMMIAIIEEIENQLELVNFGVSGTDFEVGRNQQPTNQYTGSDSDDSVKTRIFLYSVTKSNDGHGRSYTPGENFTRTDFQQRSKSIQVSVIHSFDETNINAKTPEDVADLVHDLLDSPDAIKNLRDKDIFVQNVGDVRPIFFVNDKDRNEQTPNFDLLVNYSSSITKTTGYVDVVDSVVVGV